jgi:hypothetical protein
MVHFKAAQPWGWGKVQRTRCRASCEILAKIPWLGCPLVVTAWPRRPTPLQPALESLPVYGTGLVQPWLLYYYGTTYRGYPMYAQCTNDVVK